MSIITIAQGHCPVKGFVLIGNGEWGTNARVRLYVIAIVAGKKKATEGRPQSIVFVSG